MLLKIPLYVKKLIIKINLIEPLVIPIIYEVSDNEIHSCFCIKKVNE